MCRLCVELDASCKHSLKAFNESFPRPKLNSAPVIKRTFQLSLSDSNPSHVACMCACVCSSGRMVGFVKGRNTMQCTKKYSSSSPDGEGKPSQCMKSETFVQVHFTKVIKPGTNGLALCRIPYSYLWLMFRDGNIINSFYCIAVLAYAAPEHGKIMGSHKECCCFLDQIIVDTIMCLTL